MSDRPADTLSQPRPPPGPNAAFALGPDDESRATLSAWFDQYGDLCRLPPGRDGAESWVIHHPDDIRHVLVRNHRNYTKGVGLDRVRILLGNGIMVSEGDFWARQRRMLQPCFKNAVLRRFSELIRVENLKLADAWAQAAAAGQAIEITAAVSELTLNIVLKSIFGTDLDGPVAEDGNPFALLNSAPQRDLAFAARFRGLTRVVADIIALRRREQRDEPDFLGMLMAARGRDDAPMADKALIDEIMTLIVAGHETTASALAWVWYLIATHPHAARTLRAEADQVEESRLDADSALQINYTGQVVREAMRLYPPGWLLSRRAVADDRLGGHAVAAGSHVFICPYLVHRHPRYWDAPEVFRPERFAAGPAAQERFAYIPFAAGPRHCVGESLALTEMVMHVVLMARRFEFSYAGEGTPALESRINLRPRDGIFLQLKTR